MLCIFRVNEAQQTWCPETFDNFWTIFLKSDEQHQKKLSKAIISRILYFDTHLSRYWVTPVLERSISCMTASRHYHTRYHFPCIREGLPSHFRGIICSDFFFWRNISLIKMITPNDFSPFPFRGVLSLWHFPYAEFHVYPCARAVSSPPLEEMSRLSSLRISQGVYLLLRRASSIYTEK